MISYNKTESPNKKMYKNIFTFKVIIYANDRNN